MYDLLFATFQIKLEQLLKKYPDDEDLQKLQIAISSFFQPNITDDFMRNFIKYITNPENYPEFKYNLSKEFLDKINNL